MQLKYRFFYPKTRSYFNRYIEVCDDESAVCDIFITPEFMNECRWLVEEGNDSLSYLEFVSLMIATGNKLLSYEHALFHGVALRWKGFAWIITAPSGTGKTTQLKHWKALLKDDVTVINGDKPVIECRNDGLVFVYSSPWRGKEKYGTRGICAPLKGIIVLEQGSANSISRIASEDVSVSFFNKFISFPENREQILCQAKILNHILDAVPIWKLINVGDEDSAYLTIKTLDQYLEAEK